MMKNLLFASALATSLVLPVGWTVSAGKQTDEVQEDGVEETVEGTDADESHHKDIYATYKTPILGTAAVAVLAVVGGVTWKYQLFTRIQLMRAERARTKLQANLKVLQAQTSPDSAKIKIAAEELSKQWQAYQALLTQLTPS